MGKISANKRNMINHHQKRDFICLKWNNGDKCYENH